MWNDDQGQLEYHEFFFPSKVTDRLESPMSLYHSLSPITNTLYRCISIPDIGIVSDTGTIFTRYRSFPTIDYELEICFVIKKKRNTFLEFK